MSRANVESESHSAGGDERLDVADQDMEYALAEFVTRMEPMRQDIVRAVWARHALRRFGQAFRSSPDISEPSVAFATDRIDEFWSHSWHGSRWGKILTAIYLKNGMTAALLATLASFAVMVLVGGKILPARLRESPGYPNDSCWCSLTGFLLYCVLLLQWRPWHKIFLDVLCINQHDETEKADAIVSIGAFLKSSKSLVVFWDPSYCRRLWCVFELAGYLHSRPSNTKGKLVIRPTILGPCLVSVPMALSCLVLFLGFFPWHLFSDLDLLWPVLALLVLVGFYVSVVTLRAYLRAVESLKEDLDNFTVNDSLCWCCSHGHQMPNGDILPCDRRVVFQTISAWFGTLSNFDQKVRQEVAGHLTEQLSRDVFTYRHFAVSACPLLWHFLDGAATKAYYGGLTGSREMSAAIRDIVRGCGWAFGACPVLMLLGLRFSHLLQRKCAWRLADILVNFVILGIVIAAFVAFLELENRCWDLDILDMQKVGPYELLPGTAAFSLISLFVALVLFTFRCNAARRP